MTSAVSTIVSPRRVEEIAAEQAVDRDALAGEPPPSRTAAALHLAVLEVEQTPRRCERPDSFWASQQPLLDTFTGHAGLGGSTDEAQTVS